MNCANAKELLTLYLLGDLDEKTTASVRDHIEACDGCRAEAQEVKETLGLLRDALAASSGAPARLSDGQRKGLIVRAVMGEQKRARTGRLNWFLESHPVLARCAVVSFLMLCLLGIVIPSLSTYSLRPKEDMAACSITMPAGDATLMRSVDEYTAPDACAAIPVEAEAPRPSVVRNGVIDSSRRDSGDKLRDAGATDPASYSLRFSQAGGGERTPAPSAPPPQDAKDKAGESLSHGADAPGPWSVMSGSAGGYAKVSPGERSQVAAGKAAPSLEGAKKESAAVNKPGFFDDRADAGVGGDLDVPMEPAAPVMTKSPKIVNGTPSAVAKGNRQNEYGWKDEKPVEENRKKADPVVVAGAIRERGEAEKVREKDDDRDGLSDAGELAPAKRAKQLKGLEERIIGKEIKAEIDGTDQDRWETVVVVSTNAVAASGLIPVSELKTEDVAVAPRFRAWGVNPLIEAAKNPFSTFSISVDTASYTVTRNYLMKGELPPPESVRVEEFVNYFDYAYTAPQHEMFRVYTETAPSKFGLGRHMLKIGVKGRRLGREEQRRAVLTFLVDASGSMDKADRMGLVRKSLKLLIDKLDPKDVVSIVVFNDHATLLLDGVAVADKGRILAAIDSIQCSGSTNLEEAMDRGYGLAARGFVSKAENRVVVMSDGVANLGSVAAEDILKKVEANRKQGIFCSVLGFGAGTYNDIMLQSLANKGDGTYAFIDSEDEARRVLVDDLSASLNTIAKDVKIQVEFNPGVVAQYRQIGYESRQLKKEDFRNDAVDAGEVGSGQSVTALYEFNFENIRREAAVQRRDDPVIGTVRVRYHRVDNGRVEEIEKPVKMSEVLASFDLASPRFKLAACAAGFADILRGSPYADRISFEDVARELRPVKLDLSLDKRVAELLQLVESAKSAARK